MKNNRCWWWLLTALALGLVTALQAYVYSPNGATWLPGSIPINIKVGTAATSEHGNFSNSAALAMTTWNAHLGTVQFQPQILSAGGQVDYDNDIYFDSTWEGEEFGSGVLAVTLSYITPSINQLFETDIVFNTAYTWDSYSGAWRSQGAKDFHRVAIHELGHVLGLGHPDEYGQPGIDALMNSHVSDLDHLTADDIAGAQSLYRAPGQTAPPGNDNFAHAYVINLGSGTLQVTGDSYYATKEAGEPDHDPGDGVGGASVWWKWTAPNNGSMTLTTQGSHFDTLLGVYTGSAVNALSALVVNDDVEPGVIRYSTATFTATAGTTYYFAVDGWDTEQGRVKLTLNFTPTSTTMAPYIISHPQNTTILYGANAVFTASAGGDPTPYPQWQVSANGGANWTPLTNSAPYSGVFTNTLTITAPSFYNDYYQYRCVYTHPETGTATTNAATLRMNIPPIMMGGGGTVSLYVGESINLSMNVIGTPPFTYQWQRNEVDIPGATESSLNLENVQLEDNGARYRVVVTNAYGTSASIPRTLSVTLEVALTITNQPQSIVTYIGANVSLSVSADASRSITYQWQKNGVNILGATGPTLNLTNIQVASSGDYTVVVSTSTTSITSDVATVKVIPNPAYIRTSAGDGHSLMLGDDGTLWGIGGSSMGQLGLGDISNTNVAALIMSDIVSMDAADSHTLMIDATLRLLSCGFSSNGQLGNGDQYQRQLTPLHVADNVIQAVNGSRFALHLKSDLTLWATGENDYGQFGLGDTANRTIWTKVAEEVKWIAAGVDHTVFVKTDGTMWAMGRNHLGQLGDGSTANRLSPVQIATNVDKAYAHDSDNTYFIKSDRSLWGVGINTTGQLGDGSYTNRSTPRLIASDVIDASCVGILLLFIKSDHTLWGVGSNYYGQLGIGSATEALTPTYVTNEVVGVASTDYGTTIVKTDGSSWGAGSNGNPHHFPAPSGTYRTPVPCTTPSQQRLPGAISAVTATDGDHTDGVLVTWTPALGALYYEVWRGDQNQFATAAKVADRVQVFAYFDRDVSWESTKYYWVRPVSPTGTGSISSVDSGYSVAPPPAAPQFVVQPADFTATATHGYQQNIQVTGYPTPTLQWQHLPAGDSTWSNLTENANYTGTTTTRLTILNITLAMDGDQYRCVATNNAGIANSDSATMSVIIPIPSIDQGPSNQTVAQNALVTMSVTARSMGPLTYTWQLNGTNIPNSNSATYTIASAQVGNAGNYSVRVTNSSGSIFAYATLAVITPPVISSEPASRTIYAGQTTTFAVTASSNGTLSYQWRHEGADIPGAIASTYTIPTAQASHAGNYTVVVSTIAGEVTSSPATLDVLPATAPTITKHPEDSLTAFYGVTQFRVTATGEPDPTYRWQRSPAGTDSWQDINELQPLTYAGVNSPTLLVMQVANIYANSGDRFRCIVSNLAGTATSLPATLTVSGQAAVLHPFAGYTFTKFLRVDGSLWGMGRNNEGQLGKPLSGQPFEYAPATLATGGVLTAASGAEHSMYVTVERSLWGSGYNPHGALGIGTTDNRSTPALVATNVSAVTAGVYHTLFTKTDATLWGMGWNTNGQLGVGDTTNRLSPVQIADHVLTTAGGYVHSLFVRSDGSAWAMGHNGSGQFGNGTTTPAFNPVQVSTSVSRVATGYYHSLWLKTDGSLWSAGYNAQGQLGTGDNSARSTAVQIDTDVVQIAAALFHSLYLKTDGSLWGMGDNTRGQLGTGDTANRNARVLIATDVVSVSAGLWHNLFTKADGSLWGMGANDQGQLGTGDATDRFSPVLIASGAPSLPNSVTIVYASTSDVADRVALFWKASPGSSHYEVWRNTSNDRAAATLIADRIIGNHFEDVTVAPGVTYHYWVDAVNPFGTRARTNSVTGRAGSEIISPPVITSLSPSRQVLAPGDDTTLSVTVADDTAVSYQWYFNGQAVNGATGSTLPMADADYAQAGVYWVTAANAAGSIRSNPMFVLVAPAVIQLVPWGGNSYGTVLPPTGVTEVIAIAAGDNHALGLKRDGTVLAWGDNAHGQTTVPAGLTGVVALAAGGNHSAALKSDGTVVTWGTYYSGSNASAPTGLSHITGLFTDGRGTLSIGIDGAVTGWNSSGAIANILTDIAYAVMGGTYHAAIDTDGNLQIWGGTPIGPDNMPTNLSGYSFIDAESSNYVATKTDGTVVQWGRFNNGQANAPTGLNTVMAVAAAEDHSLALKQDGTVVAWGGYNAYGQANVPAGLNQVFAIAAGGTHSLALRDASTDTAPSIVTQPADRTVALGGEFTLSVVAEGTLVTYEWRQGEMTLAENSRLTGVRTATLQVTNAQLADAGGYTVTVRNSKGIVTSQIATVTVDKLPQTITFPALDDRGYTQTVVNLSATASSGLPVTFSVVSGPATITGTQLRLTGPGTVTVRAIQAGDLTYASAVPIDRTFIVTANLLSWNEEQFTSTELADASISGPTADPDDDGLTNLLEYALDLNPKSVNTTGLPEMSTSATDWTYTYTRPADRADLTYEVETSTDLVNWTTTGVTHTMTADHGTTQTWQATIPLNSASNVFFRLKITGTEVP